MRSEDQLEDRIECFGYFILVEVYQLQQCSNHMRLSVLYDSQNKLEIL